MTDGGERRLNVAITRARHEVVLFSSFQPEDIDLARTSSKGLHDLREYLAFARDSDEIAAASAQYSTASTGHQAEVAHAFGAAGLEVIENVGMSGFKVDLAVRAEGSPRWLAVLLDGPGWARRRTASDRDVLPNSVLTGNMGWPAVERVWLPGWIRDRDEVVERIVGTAHDIASAPEPEALHSAVSDNGTTPFALEPEEEPHEVQTAPAVRIAGLSTAAAPAVSLGSSSQQEQDRPRPRHASPAAADSHLTGHDVKMVPFDAATSDKVLLDGALDRLHEPMTRAKVRQRLEEIVAIEGPIEGQRLASLIGLSFGLMRVRQARIDELLVMVPADRKHREGNHDFVWPYGLSPDDYQLVRVSQDVAHRSVEQISLIELGNAIRSVLGELQGMPRDALRREVMALFGFRREGGNIRARLDDAIDTLAASGKLRATGSFVVVND